VTSVVGVARAANPARSRITPELTLTTVEAAWLADLLAVLAKSVVDLDWWCQWWVAANTGNPQHSLDAVELGQY
jgi:hypothetical protein